MSYTTSYKAENARAKKLRRQAGEWLKGLRIDAGLTQRELAERIGNDYYTFISQVECGAARVPPPAIAAWAGALGVPLDELAKKLLSFYDPHTYTAIFGK